MQEKTVVWIGGAQFGFCAGAGELSQLSAMIEIAANATMTAERGRRAGTNTLTSPEFA